MPCLAVACSRISPELNRKPVPKGVFDFITHTGCPIVHAPDDISVMETLETLPWIFFSARTMIGKVPYHIGPTSIPCRDNPYGAAVAPNPDNRRVCLSDIDPRQRGLFAAAWNLGYLSAGRKSRCRHRGPWLCHWLARDDLSQIGPYPAVVRPRRHQGLSHLPCDCGCCRCERRKAHRYGFVCTFKGHRSCLSQQGRPSALARQPVRRDPAREGQGLRWPCQTAMFSTKEALKQRCAIPPGSTAAAPSSARVGSLELPSAWVARIRAANVHMLLGCVPASLRAAVEK